MKLATNIIKPFRPGAVSGDGKISVFEPEPVIRIHGVATCARPLGNPA